MKKIISAILYLTVFYIFIVHSDSILSSIQNYPELYIAGIISLAMKPYLERFFG